MAGKSKYKIAQVEQLKRAYTNTLFSTTHEGTEIAVEKHMYNQGLRVVPYWLAVIHSLLVTYRMFFIVPVLFIAVFLVYVREMVEIHGYVFLIWGAIPAAIISLEIYHTIKDTRGAWKK